MSYIQVNIKVDAKIYPEIANKLLYLRKNRKVQKAFREFLIKYEENEKQQKLL